MPKINITSKSKYDANEAFKRIRDLLENDSDLRKLDPNYICTFDNAKLCGNAKSGMFKANLEVKPDGDSSIVSIDIDLPFHMALMRGMIQKTLQKKLDRSLSR